MSVSAIPMLRSESSPRALERIFLQPGAMFIAERPAVINTILGSSVAVCLWSPQIAGMCHFVLAGAGSDASARFGDAAIASLVQRMIMLGGRHDEIVAAMFGGAYLLSGSAPMENVGQRNIREAVGSLAREGVPLIRREVGGGHARRVAFHTIDGTTVVTRI